MDVLEIILVAPVADRPETLVHHDFGEAQDRIERRPDFVTDLSQKIRFQGTRALGFLAGSLKLPLDFFPMREIAQNCAKPDLALCPRAGRAADTAKCHKDRNRAALSGEANDLAPPIEQIDAA